MRRPTRPALASTLAAALLAGAPTAGRAWIYPEHRDIAVAAFERLSPADRQALEEVWSVARQGLEAKLCARPSEGDQGLEPPCIDFAAFPALSGDHACSPKDVVENVLPSEWILGVARVAAKTKQALATAPDRPAKLNRIAASNVWLQVVDDDYATRAGANNAHFLLPRTGDDAEEYLVGAIRQGAPLNAIGLYVQYHIAALALAQRHATEPPPDAAARAAMARRILALEGYALHWLQDSYSAGHVVGTWGDVAWRKGTHDYYDEAGVETTDWTGKRLIMYGDSFMRSADLERASAEVALSLGRLAEALVPGSALGEAAPGFGPGPDAIYAFDSCKEEVQPRAAGTENRELVRRMAPVVLATPVPGRDRGDVHLPRFREELGPFLGAFGAITGGGAWGGLFADGLRGTAALAAGVRLGFGAESLTGSPGTALVFVEAGLAMATAQVNEARSDCTGAECVLGTLTLFPAVPSRTGLRLGARIPFWLIPGDTILLVPILALASPVDGARVAITAASGGLLMYEQTFLTGAGSFQIVLGREVQVTLFGFLGKDNVPLIVFPYTNPDGSADAGVAGVKSVALGFPVLEWTPFRSFATRLAFAVQLQLGFGVELASSVEVLAPAGAAPPNVPPTWSVFLRGTFDGRFFLGSREDLGADVAQP